MALAQPPVTPLPATADPRLDNEGAGDGQVALGVPDCNLNDILDSEEVGPDATGRKLYWTTGGVAPAGIVGRINLDGTDPDTLLTNQSAPFDIAVDPIGGKIYFNPNTPGPSPIARANLDGTGLETLFSVGGNQVYSLDIDVAAGKIYWVEWNGSFGIIRRANFDGTILQTPVPGNPGDQFFTIRLDVPAGKMYWTSEGLIRRANLDGTGVETLVTPSEAWGLALDIPAGKMYWLEFLDGSIKRANLDGTAVETVVTGIVSAENGIAVDSARGMIYWAELGADKIRRMPAEGGLIEDLLTVDAPLGVALDLSGADCNSNGVLDECDLGGTLITVAPISDTDAVIPDCPNDNSANPSVTKTMNVLGFDSIVDLNVGIDMVHAFIGDLVITLTHEDTGTTVALMSRIGLAEIGPYCTDGECCGCNDANFGIQFDDEAALDIENACPPLGEGEYFPNPGATGLSGRLSDFDNESLGGTWTLEVFDAAGADTGFVDALELVFTVLMAPTDPDCNFNGSPDECDISSGISLDVAPTDGVPDECCGASGLCATPGQEDYWTCFNNWNIPGNVYPDDEQGGAFADIHAKIEPGVSLFLDETVQIPSLHIKPGATLRVAVEPNPIVGDLRFSPPGVLLVEGALYVDGPRQIGEPASLNATPPHPCIIAAEGEYAVEPNPVAPVNSTTLYARDLIVLSGSEPSQDGGHVELTDHMSAVVARNLILAGTTSPDALLPLRGADQSAPPTMGVSSGAPPSASSEPGAPATSEPVLGPQGSGVGMEFEIRNPKFEEEQQGSEASSQQGADDTDWKSQISNLKSEISDVSGTGAPTPEYVNRQFTPQIPTSPPNDQILSFHTPPSLIIRNSADIVINGDMILGANAGIENTAASPTYLAGDFINESVSPGIFHWTHGRLVLDGNEPQTFEVGGLDLGASVDGFYSIQNTIGDLGPHENFSIGTLEIAPGADVTFVNNFANTIGTENCQEALYVRNLIIGTDASVRAEQCKVYYGELHASGSWVGVNCGSLDSAPLPDSPLPAPGGLNKPRFISFSLPPSGGASTALRVRAASLHRVDPSYSGSIPVPFSQFEGRAVWVGQPRAYLESTTNRTPFLASYLECGPTYINWSQVGACTDNVPPFEYDLNGGSLPACQTNANCGPGETCNLSTVFSVTGAMIAPSSTYGVENVAQSCAENEVDCADVSAPLAVKTTRDADVTAPFNPPSPSVQPDVTDISAGVDKFRSVPTAPTKVQALVAGDLNGLINMKPDYGFNNISLLVDGFRGVGYQLRPGKCAGDPSVRCRSDAECMLAAPCQIVTGSFESPQICP